MIATRLPLSGSLAAMAFAWSVLNTVPAFAAGDDCPKAGPFETVICGKRYICARNPQICLAGVNPPPVPPNVPTEPPAGPNSPSPDDTGNKAREKLRKMNCQQLAAEAERLNFERTRLHTALEKLHADHYGLLKTAQDATAVWVDKGNEYSAQGKVVKQAQYAVNEVCGHGDRDPDAVEECSNAKNCIAGRETDGKPAA